MPSPPFASRDLAGLRRDRADDQRGRDDARLIAAHVDKAAFLAAARDVGRSRECRVLFIRERCVERKRRLSYLCCVCGHFVRVVRPLLRFRRHSQYYLDLDWTKRVSPRRYCSQPNENALPRAESQNKLTGKQPTE